MFKIFSVKSYSHMSFLKKKSSLEFNDTYCFLSFLWSIKNSTCFNTYLLFVLQIARCFQLVIQKKIFRIFEKHSIPRDGWHIYITVCIWLSRKLRLPIKKDHDEKTWKIFCSQSVTFNLSQASISKNKRIWVIRTLKKKNHWCGWKYLFT